jgi:hypothetical protein
MQKFFKKWEKRELLEKGARAIVAAIFKDGLLGPVDAVLPLDKMNIEVGKYEN